MDLNMNISGVNTPITPRAATLPTTGSAATPSPILGGPGLVVSTSGGKDLEGLIATLINETNESVKNSRIFQFSSLAAVFAAAGLNDEGLTQAQINLDESVNALVVAEEAEAAASQEVDRLKAELNALEASKPGGTTTEGADVTEATEPGETTVAGPEAPKTPKSGKKSTEKIDERIAEIRGRLEAAETAYTQAKNDLDEKSKAVVSAMDNLDTSSYNALKDALLANIHDGDKEELKLVEDKTEEDEKEKAGILPYSERSPIDIIKDAIRRASGDTLDTLETRRENLI